MPLPAGSVIADRFAIEKVAGSGGMGTVYRAVDQNTGRPVALKLLHREASAARSTERFAREAELLAQIDHPNIVAYVAHGETADGLRYLAMQWLAGQDLAERLAGGRLTLRDSVACLTAVADALGTLHGRGIVHRDASRKNTICLHNSGIPAQQRRQYHTRIHFLYFSLGGPQAQARRSVIRASS